MSEERPEDEVVRRIKRFHYRLQAGLFVVALVVGLAGAWVITRE
jgi:hypothetical protein